jgi:hypothetical protein
VAQPSGHLGSSHRGTHLPADGESDARLRRRTRSDMHNQAATGDPATPAHRLNDVLVPPEPIGRRQHARQAERRVRPFARRLVITARPARVRIRSRKPCVFARRRLFGWNVRFITGSGQGRSPLLATNEVGIPPGSGIGSRNRPKVRTRGRSGQTAPIRQPRYGSG